MTRRLLSLIVATVMAVALLPAVAAFAQANATASIAAAQRDILPGTRNFTVTVNSTESGNSITGTRINAVYINVPAGPAGITLQDGNVGTPPAGWTGKVVKAGNLQTIEYHATTNLTGTGVAPGGTVSFTFPTTVVAPLSADRVGTFTVAVSSDGGNNVKSAAPSPADGLTAKVRILEIINGSLKPTAPAGVTNGTATAEQTGLKYEFQVRNHARSTVPVTAKLASALEKINGQQGEAQQTADVLAGETGTFEWDVDLGPASSNRTATFAANAVVGTVAQAIQRTAGLTVQIRPVLSITNIRPDRTASSRDGITVKRDFTATATKNGGPALTVNSGSLEFAQVLGDKAGKMTVPVTFNNTSGQTISFPETTVLGLTGVYTATLSFTGTDANGKPFNQQNIVEVPNAITIDNLAPIIDLVQSTLPTTRGIPQSAAKPGDTISVSVKVSAVDRDIDNSTLKVALEQDAGGDIPVPCAPSSSDGGLSVTCTGSVAAAFAPEAKTFKAKVTVKDLAGNPATDVESATRDIDRELPVLSGPGRLQSPTTIKVTFTDNLPHPIYGGCDPSQYTVDGQIGSVVKVTFDGADLQCGLNSKDEIGSGVRILHLRDAREPNARPQVEYTRGNRQLSSDPAFDGAAHDAANAVIQTVTDIVPEAPVLRAAFRNTSGSQARETAYFDADEPARFAGGPSGAYFTRFVGEDLVIRFTGAYDGYAIQVLDQDDEVLATTKDLRRTRSAVLNQPQATEWEVKIPLGAEAADGTYLRKLRFVEALDSPNELLGDKVAFQVVVDRVLPGLASAVLEPNSTTKVRTTFSEKIVEGTNNTVDWVGNERTPNEEDADARTYYFADAVENVSQTARLLTFAFPGEGPYGGVDYFLRSTSGLRYKDRAGNALNNTLG